jgi:hypothetical protein
MFESPPGFYTLRIFLPGGVKVENIKLVKIEAIFRERFKHGNIFW